MAQETAAKKQYHTHISSGRRWFDLNLKEVWQYRDLILLFTKRSFQLTYKQTVLGLAWIFLSPLLTSLIYTFVFGGIAKIGTDGVPHILFYLTSNAIWTFFAACVNKNAHTFTDNAGVFGKVYFPRLTIPVSNVISAMIQFGIQMLLVIAFLVYFVITGEVHPNWAYWPLIPVVLIHLGVMGLGFGIIISSLTTKYRDLAILVTFGVQLWMYATPIVYPLSQLGDGVFRTILQINPVTAPVEAFRFAVLGQGSISPVYVAISWAVTILVALFGIMLFNRVEKTFMDTV
ncbi:MAG: ABC transporter permease [Clostridia bacterium]|nr:ABC transporter permease [Clostridia bacterium]